MVRSSGTLRTPKAVPHLDFRTISCRFPDVFVQFQSKIAETPIFGFPSHGSKIDRLRGSLAWIKNRPSSGFLGMDQKSTVFGVPWHGSHHIRSHHIRSNHIRSHHIRSHQIRSDQITSHHITSHHIRSDQITSHHITSHHITSQHGPGAKRQTMARNGSGIYENQHNLVKMARNFDASPAVTTGMRQDPYVGPFYRVSGSKRPGRRHGAPAL